MMNEIDINASDKKKKIMLTKLKDNNATIIN